MTILGIAKPSILGTEKPLVLGTRKPQCSREISSQLWGLTPDVKVESFETPLGDGDEPLKIVIIVVMIKV